MEGSDLGKKVRKKHRSFNVVIPLFRSSRTTAGCRGGASLAGLIFCLTFCFFRIECSLPAEEGPWTRLCSGSTP
jgi:hypothetical protein